MHLYSTRWIPGALRSLLALAALTALLTPVTTWASLNLVLLSPTSPVYFYRLEIREPADVFAAGFAPHGVHVPGVTRNNDLLYHLGQVEEQEQASNWVSVSGSRTDSRFRMNAIAGLPQPPARLWSYVVRPNANAFSAEWALTEYTQRNPPGHEDRVAQAQDILRLPDIGDIWSVLGGIPPTDVVRASLFEFDPTRRGYRFTGTYLSNPNVVERTLPAPVETNPLDRYVDPHTGVTYTYVPGRRDSDEDQGSMAEQQSLPMSCVGTPPPDAASSRSARSADTCLRDAQHIRRFMPPTTARPNRLAFKFATGTYCLKPKPADRYVGSEFVRCDKNAPEFVYDEYRRLVTTWKQNDWCLTAPQSVSNAASPDWDYVRFEPCVVRSKDQKWSIRDGQIYAYQGDYRLQEWKNQSMLSPKEDGNSIQLEKSQFSADFFDGPSPARSHQVELEMGWSWNGSTYYANTSNSSPWNYHYTTRSYYDYQRQTISYINLSASRKKHPEPPAKYCLRSRQAESTVHDWDWTEWKVCTDLGDPQGWSRRWVFDSRTDAANNPTKVRWRDLAGNPLWISAQSNQNGGFHFNALNDQLTYFDTSVREFSIRPEAVRFGRQFEPRH